MALVWFVVAIATHGVMGGSDGVVSVTTNSAALLSSSKPSDDEDGSEGGEPGSTAPLTHSRPRLLRAEAHDGASLLLSPEVDDVDDDDDGYPPSPQVPQDQKSDLIATGNGQRRASQSHPSHRNSPSHRKRHSDPTETLAGPPPAPAVSDFQRSSPSPSAALNLVAFHNSLKPTEDDPGWLVLDFKAMCAQYHPGGAYPLKAVSCNSWKLQKFYFDGEKIRSKEDQKCLDHNTTDNKVHLSECHIGANQKWKRTSSKQIKSLSTGDNAGKCLEYDTHDNHLGALILKSCAANVLQEWTFKKEKKTTVSSSSSNFAQHRVGHDDKATLVSRNRGGRKSKGKQRRVAHPTAGASAKTAQHLDTEEADSLEAELSKALHSGKRRSSKRRSTSE